MHDNFPTAQHNTRPITVRGSSRILQKTLHYFSFVYEIGNTDLHRENNEALRQLYKGRKQRAGMEEEKKREVIEKGDLENANEENHREYEKIEKESDEGKTE